MEWDQRNLFMKPFTECPEIDHFEKYQLYPRTEELPFMATRPIPLGSMSKPTLPKPIKGLER